MLGGQDAFTQPSVTQRRLKQEQAHMLLAASMGMGPICFATVTAQDVVQQLDTSLVRAQGDIMLHETVSRDTDVHSKATCKCPCID